MKLRFHDGREEPVPSDKMFEFENDAMISRLFGSRTVDATEVVDELGPYTLDFTNMHVWGEQIPDIDQRSARLFSIWCEEEASGKVVGVGHGFFLLFPFTFDKPAIEDFYYFTEDTIHYPIAVFRVLKFAEMPDDDIDMFLDETLDAVETVWEKTLDRTIKHLEPNSPLWRRYAMCFKKIIQFSFVCPTIDRALIDALRRREYKTTGILQVMSSPSRAYDEATIEHHLETAKELAEKFSDNNR